MKMTMKGLKTEWSKLVVFFKERDAYRIQLRGWIKKYGLAGLPPTVLKTVPTDLKVLYEIKWYLQPMVWWRFLQIVWLNEENEGFRRLKDV